MPLAVVDPGLAGRDPAALHTRDGAVDIDGASVGDPGAPFAVVPGPAQPPRPPKLVVDRASGISITGELRFRADTSGGGLQLVEFERYFTPAWGAAFFVDSGSAFDNTPDWRTGVGVGARWKSPVGPVRIDIARGLDDPDSSFQLHISLGADL